MVTAHPHNAPDASGDHTGTSSTVSPILVTGLTNGTQYDITVVAHNAVGDGAPGTTDVTPVAPPARGGGGSDPPPPTGDSTDSHADGMGGPGKPVGTAGDASPQNPIVTTVEPSIIGPVVIDETPAAPGEVPGGWSVIGQHVTITAPTGSADSPLIVTFRIDASALPAGDDIGTISIFRDGVRAEPCGAVGADPGFCIASVELDGGAVVVVVHTEHASVWDIGVPANGSIDAACANVPASAGFVDVGSDSVHRSAIDCLAAWGIAHGLDSSHFGPEQSVTRAQVASFLDRVLRSSGMSLPDGPDVFVDDEGSVHEAAINRLAAAGVIQGTDATHFQPDAPVSRSQMASLLERAYALCSGRTLSGAPDAFTDDTGSVHEAAINEIALLGIAKGTAQGTFDPTSSVRRDQMASFVARLLSRFVAEGHAPPFHAAHWWSSFSRQ
jgi:hypothetical protein